MKALLILIVAHTVACQSIQKPSTVEGKLKRDQSAQSLEKLQELLQNKLELEKNSQPSLKTNGPIQSTNVDFKNSSRKPKSLGFFPFFPPPPMAYGLPPGFFFSRSKEVENAYPTEWLSRTEPFKKNPPLLDSPTYYIRLPPNPYIFIPGIGYVSRPPALSDPELLESNKPEQLNDVGNDVHDSFYKVPINFISNGKPTSVYQLPNGHAIPKPESSFVNLNKGPYVFNGKPNEIYLVAQIYDALYGDELSHFYP